MKNFSVFFKIVLLIIISCSVYPDEIEYGVDNCHFCSMTIIDNKFSAELVTTKGKVFKFDAIECMISFINDHTELKYSYILSADYSSPGNLFDAQIGTFIISKNIPSPMGAFLSGYVSEDIAMEVLSEADGNLYSWNSLQRELISR